MSGSFWDVLDRKRSQLNNGHLRFFLWSCLQVQIRPEVGCDDSGQLLCLETQTSHLCRCPVFILFWIWHLISSSRPRCRRCSSWGRSPGRWWRSCRRLPSERCPPPSGAPAPSTGLREGRAFRGIHATTDGWGGVFTVFLAEKGVAAEVCDLHHHAVVHHAVGGLQAAVDLDVTGVEVGHALSTRVQQDLKKSVECYWHLVVEDGTATFWPEWIF